MKIFFRADGDKHTGLGHIMRSAALAQILMKDFECIFYTRNKDYFPFREFAQPPLVVDVLEEHLRDAEHLAKIASKEDVVVLDGYKFDTPYQQILKDAGIKLLCIDDIIAYHFVSDFVLNHAGGIDASLYSAESYTQFLLGPGYALVKPVFLHRRAIDNIEAESILVSLGGADIHNHTKKVLDRLTEKPLYQQIHVVTGAANPHYDSLVASYGKNTGITFYKNLSAQEMYGLMSRSAHAVLPPSTICYEYMSVGGVVFLVQTADNQQRIREYFISKELAFDLEMFGKISGDRMKASIEKQATVFDGRSPERLLKAFHDIKKAISLKITSGSGN